MAKYGFKFNPFTLTGVRVPAKNREAALDAVGNWLLETSLSEIGAGRSPVAGGPWKKSLTPEYREKKKDESSVTVANLELTGEMLDALGVDHSGSQLFYGVEGDRALVGKAEGNNIGTYGREGSGDDSKARRFVPLEGETFTPKIIAGMREILEDFVE